MRYAIVFTAIIVALFCRAFVVSVYKVPSQTMAPTILSGDFIIASQMSYGIKFPWSREVYFSRLPKRGELVAFVKDSKIFIKRVMAVEKDTLEFNKTEFIVNSQKCTYTDSEVLPGEQYELVKENCGDFSYGILRPTNPAHTLPVPFEKLQKEQIFVASDNRSLENNPNALENISYDQIIGKPLFIWMSYSSTQDFISKTLGVRWNRILTNLH